MTALAAKRVAINQQGASTSHQGIFYSLSFSYFWRPGGFAVRRQIRRILSWVVHNLKRFGRVVARRNYWPETRRLWPYEGGLPEFHLESLVCVVHEKLMFIAYFAFIMTTDSAAQSVRRESRRVFPWSRNVLVYIHCQFGRLFNVTGHLQ